uniref:Uncharacterized protein n=1 Tax=Anopheles atroparvus TaxID=41427 RepID=A0A182IJV7_ANOAO
MEIGQARAETPSFSRRNEASKALDGRVSAQRHQQMYTGDVFPAGWIPPRYAPTPSLPSSRTLRLGHDMAAAIGGAFLLGRLHRFTAAAVFGALEMLLVVLLVLLGAVLGRGGMMVGRGRSGVMVCRCRSGSVSTVASVSVSMSGVGLAGNGRVMRTARDQQVMAALDDRSHRRVGVDDGRSWHHDGVMSAGMLVLRRGRKGHTHHRQKADRDETVHFRTLGTWER